MTIEVVLFDLGGVLIELSGMPTMASWTQLSDAEFWHQWLHSPAVRRFESGFGTSDQFAAEVVQEFGLNVGSEEFLAHFEQWPRDVFPEGIKLVQSLKDEGYRVACLSNSNHLHWQRFTIEMPILSLFDPALASHQTGLLKPDEKSFTHAITTLGVPANHILFLDDNQINVDAAQDSGMQAALTRGIDQARERIKTFGLL